MQISEIIKKIPLWALVAIFFAFVVLFLLIIFINFLFKEQEELKVKKHREPTPHELIIDMQQKLIEEMRSASHQNWIMITLTIIFILVSIIGGTVVVRFFDEITKFLKDISPYVYNSVIKPFSELFKFKITR